MLERLTQLPAGVVGVRAQGKLTKSDYDRVIRPLLNEARAQGSRLRCICQIEPEFEGLTPAALWEDVRLGFKHLYDFERFAIVSDAGWVRRMARIGGSIMPCPSKVFDNDQWDEALRWVSTPPHAERLSHTKLTEQGVVVVEPQGRLRAEDFEDLARSVDPWISQRGKLNGIVVHTHSFPGWENLGAFLRHLRFLRDHRDKTRRLALATDTPIAGMAPHIVRRLLDAEVKRFRYDQLEQAIEWASETEGRAANRARTNGSRQPSPSA